MEVRQLQASRFGDEAPMRLDAGRFGNAREGDLGEKTRFNGQLSDVADLGTEFDVDRAVLGVAQAGAKLPRRVIGTGNRSIFDIGKGSARGGEPWHKIA
jgi:hypothetical protein